MGCTHTKGLYNLTIDTIVNAAKTYMKPTYGDESLFEFYQEWNRHAESYNQVRQPSEFGIIFKPRHMPHQFQHMKFCLSTTDQILYIINSYPPDDIDTRIVRLTLANVQKLEDYYQETLKALKLVKTQYSYQETNVQYPVYMSHNNKRFIQRGGIMYRIF